MSGCIVRRQFLSRSVLLWCVVPKIECAQTSASVLLACEPDVTHRVHNCRAPQGRQGAAVGSGKQLTDGFGSAHSKATETDTPGAILVVSIHKAGENKHSEEFIRTVGTHDEKLTSSAKNLLVKATEKKFHC